MLLQVALQTHCLSGRVPGWPIFKNKDIRSKGEEPRMMERWTAEWLPSCDLWHLNRCEWERTETPWLLGMG